MRNAGLKNATVTRAENVPKNARNRNIAIISLKSMAVVLNGPTKWQNALGQIIQTAKLAFQRKSKREKSNLSALTDRHHEKKLKLYENVDEKSRKSGDRKKNPSPQPHFVKTHKLELVLHDDYCHLQCCAQWEIFFFIVSAIFRY